MLNGKKRVYKDKKRNETGSPSNYMHLEVGGKCADAEEIMRQRNEEKKLKPAGKNQKNIPNKALIIATKSQSTATWTKIQKMPPFES